MTEFIRLEAQEKAREIRVKADEDFEKDKAALILQEKEVIDAAYESSFKQAAMSLQITRSKANAKARLALLGAGQTVVDDIFDAAQKKLTDATRNGAGKQGYQDALRKLILEGMYHLNEDAVAVRCRKADRAAAEKAMKDAAAEFEEEVGRPVKVEIDGSEWLSDKS
jgi:V-type H+-transporting ATPase subunit E